MGKVVWVLFGLVLICAGAQSQKFKTLGKFSKALFKHLSTLSAVRDTNTTTTTIYDYLQQQAYPYEVHHVTTEDGYILGVQRITGGRNQTGTPKKSKPAVILQHGLISNSFDFLNRGPGKSIGFMLADAGWDVWLSNNRGNLHSRNHTTLDPDVDKAFWDYSFDECGYYDVPAVIDHILRETGVKKVFYIGHSQGTSQFFAMAALRPEYNDKIALMSALAPIAHMNHMSSPIPRLAALNMDPLITILDLLNWNELLPYDPSYQAISGDLSGDATFQVLSEFLLFVFGGFNPHQFTPDIMKKILIGDPAGISRKMLIHYGQEIVSGHFRRYDYGFSGNLDRYKTPEPPLYNISAMTSPITLYYSSNDFFAAENDVEKLASELPNLVLLKHIDDIYFTHLDFIWAKDVDTLLNNDVIAQMNEYVAIMNKGNDDDGGNAGNTITSNILINMACMYVLYILIK